MMQRIFHFYGRRMEIFPGLWMLGISVMGPAAAAPRFVLYRRGYYKGYCAKIGGSSRINAIVYTVENWEVELRLELAFHVPKYQIAFIEANSLNSMPATETSNQCHNCPSTKS